LLRLASGIYAKMTLILLFSVHFWWNSYNTFNIIDHFQNLKFQ
jgi:hypothetical protein